VPCTGNEVGVLRYQNANLPRRELENGRVVGRLQPEFSHVQGIVTCRSKTASEPWRQRIVDKESQVSVSSGNWRSSTAAAADASA